MSVKVRVFYPELQRLIGGAVDVRADGKTVGECLNDLSSRHPGVAPLLFDVHGLLHKHVYVYVNAEGMFKADLGRPVTDDDHLIIAVLATAG